MDNLPEMTTAIITLATFVVGTIATPLVKAIFIKHKYDEDKQFDMYKLMEDRLAQHDSELAELRDKNIELKRENNRLKIRQDSMEELEKKVDDVITFVYVLRSQFDHLPLPVWVLDDKGAVKYINPTFENTFDRSYLGSKGKEEYSLFGDDNGQDYQNWKEVKTRVRGYRYKEEYNNNQYEVIRFPIVYMDSLLGNAAMIINSTT